MSKAAIKAINAANEILSAIGLTISTTAITDKAVRAFWRNAELLACLLIDSTTNAIQCEDADSMKQNGYCTLQDAAEGYISANLDDWNGKTWPDSLSDIRTVIDRLRTVTANRVQYDALQAQTWAQPEARVTCNPAALAEDARQLVENIGTHTMASAVAHWNVCVARAGYAGQYELPFVAYTRKGHLISDLKRRANELRGLRRPEQPQTWTAAQLAQYETYFNGLADGEESLTITEYFDALKPSDAFRVTEPGEYLTRDGRRVTVYEIYCGSIHYTFPVKGHIWKSFRGKMAPRNRQVWMINGRLNAVGTNGADIVGPYNPGKAEPVTAPEGLTVAGLAIGCTTQDGETGSYLYSPAHGLGFPVSPVFRSLVEFFDWAAENGWRGDERAEVYTREKAEPVTFESFQQALDSGRFNHGAMSGAMLKTAIERGEVVIRPAAESDPFAERYQVATMSTGHLSERTLSILNAAEANGDLPYWLKPTGFGWIFWADVWNECREDLADAAERGTTSSAILECSDLAEIWQAMNSHGYQWAQLDADGPIIPGLRTYEHNGLHVEPLPAEKR